MNTHDIKRYAVSGDIAYPIHEEPEGDYVTYEDHVAAIEADRKRRGEPVAWIRKNGFRFISEIEPQDDSEVPLFTAPQPDEPESCFCDRMYPDSNPDASCGDCPTRDYGAKAAEPAKVRPETLSEHIARDIREGRFPEKSDRKMVPAEPVKVPSDAELEKAWDSFEAEMARHPTDDELEEFMAQFADEMGHIHDDQHAEAARALLARYGPPAQPAIPDGWNLVPTRPTDDMLKAAQRAWLADPLRQTSTLWTAMLAAAPQPEENGR